MRALLFDFGGTLDSDGGHWFDRTCRLYADHSVPVDYSHLKQAFYAADEALEADPGVRTLGLRPLLERHFAIQVRRLGLRGADVAALLAQEFGRPMEECLTAARAALERLRPRFRLGVVSNFYGNLAPILDEFGIAPLLDVALDSAVEGVRKPDPAIYHLALSRLGLPGKAVCMIGDSLERDIAPARALGMRTIWLHEPEKSAPAEKYDLEVVRLADAVEFLERATERSETAAGSPA
ncbi:MAG: HAD family hydrolase [Planctomycetes bacterium]|nr:HAD family hydrolase [Planctomycetota bacterium]